MIKNYITDIFLNKTPFELTHDQIVLVDIFSSFILCQNERDLLLLKGYAGTGKTSMISIFIQTLHELKFKTVLLAPTGRASKVLSSFSGFPASTIHKKIYKQKTARDAFGEFNLDRNLNTNTFFIVDEASMISDRSSENSLFGSGNLLDDLITYVYNDRNCKLVLVGDTAQLPPVNLPLSLAMDEHYLESYHLNVIPHELKEVVRQEKDSGILTNATSLRKIITEENENLQPQFLMTGFSDIIRIAGNEILENISNAYNKYGKDDTIIVCRSNKIANKYNQGIRAQILFREEEIAAGDYLMVVKNNYHWLTENDATPFIANGDIVKVKRVRKFQDLFGFRFAEADLLMPDYDNLEITAKILLDTLYVDAPSLAYEDNKKLFYTIAEEEYGDITPLKKRNALVKENPFFNALQVKFAYAITCHKSQGGQWSAVFIDQSYFREDMLTKDYLRWLYTAFTRATEKVYMVNFGDEFFK
jgi:exodeoxyribonuclease-5